MKYTLRILRSAQRSLARIEQHTRDRIIAAIRALAEEPRPAGCRKLSGRAAWRIRVGDYRVIYEILDTELLITVIVIRHRGSVYRD